MEKQLKILQVIQFLSQTMGGSSIVVGELSRYLAKLGHKVTICTTDYAYDDEFANQLVGVEKIKFASSLGSYRYTPKIKEWFVNNVPDYDVVHLNNYWSYQNIRASECAKRLGVPVVFSPHGSLPIQHKSFAAKYFYDLIYGRKMMRNCAKIVAITSLEMKQIKKKGISDEKINIIPNGVVLQNGTHLFGGVFRDKFNIDHSDKLILFLGRIHWIKGLDLLIDSFYDVLCRRSDVKLVITGPDDGFLSGAVKKINKYGISSSVIITGPLFGDMKYLAYKNASIYVLPSRYEMFGSTILEACSCGVPVVITDTCGIADVINGVCGEVAGFDRKELTAAIIKLLGSSALRAEYGKNGEKLVRENYTWEKIANMYEKLYLGILDHH